MTDAAVRLVQSIRSRYPGATIMVNRGYGVLPRIVDDIDMVMGESVRSTYDPVYNDYRLVPDDAYRWQCDRLREVRLLRREVGIFTLDYWFPDDAVGISRLYTEEQANGFTPYVATIDLGRVVTAP